jgi:hypothetical protein
MTTPPFVIRWPLPSSDQGNGLFLSNHDRVGVIFLRGRLGCLYSGRSQLFVIARDPSFLWTTTAFRIILPLCDSEVLLFP